MTKEELPASVGHTVSRRALLAWAAGAAACVAIGVAPRAFGEEASPLRPPGGQDERRFAALCIRCDRCRSACGQDAIGLGLLEEGFSTARMPVMRFRLGYCDMCGGDFKCMAACPTEALQSFDPLVHKMGVAVIDQSECPTYGNSARCDARCVDSCQWDALSLDQDGRLVLNQEACNGCGACEFVCVSRSYGSYGSSGRRGINIEPWQGEEK